MSDPIPLLDLSAQHGPIEEECVEAFRRILRSGVFILGEEVRLLEEEVAALNGVRHAVALSSGTDALLVALLALDIGPGDEVIVPDFTFFATASAVARLGATPVFADVCPLCQNITPRTIAPLITPRTKAVIPVHLYGQMADMQPILDMARQHGFAVVEDAAQAMGASYHGKKTGAWGDCAIFSFYPTKNLGAMGDAGMLATDSDELAEKARYLRNHGSEKRYYHRYLGGNFRCDHLQGAILRIKLRHYEAYNRERAAIAARYTQLLEPLDGVARLSPETLPCAEGGCAARQPDGALVLPVALPDRVHLWNQYTVRVTGDGARDRLKALLQQEGIASEIYYPLRLSEQECFAHLPAPAPPTHQSRRLTQEVLSLPNYPGLAPAAIERVARTVATFLADESF
jgi:dTDP-4-amino-4,6-dideoxygalactose transaminase